MRYRCPFPTKVFCKAKLVSPLASVVANDLLPVVYLVVIDRARNLHLCAEGKIGETFAN